MKRRHGVFIALLILTTALACAVPAIPTASQLPPPTPDTRLGTMVAETVSAALALTQQAVPTPTIPPTPTPQPTATATPELLESSGSDLQVEEDDRAIFTDERAGYRIEIPSTWLALRINQQEYLDAWLMPEASNPAIQRFLGDMQNQDSTRFRLFLLDPNEEHIDGGFVTNANLLWNDQQEISLADETNLTEIADALPTSMPGVEVMTVETVTLANDVVVGVITTRLPATTLDDVEVVIFQKQIFINLPTGMLTITLSTTETWRETAEPLFDEMIESFSLAE